MFSGIRSMLFGYTDSTTANNEGDLNDESSKNVSSSDSQLSQKIIEKSNDTSALLEQTLNAATTKFTEQLLPQSPSIEQLQSSSRQLLPTLNEQHEEDENKRKQNELLEEKAKSEQNGDEDDECLIADSWELLDLVEEPKASVSSQKCAVQSVEFVVDGGAKTSGILKQKGNTSFSYDDPDSAAAAAGSSGLQRQKPKVSFETPDLVTGKKKIEPTTSKGKDPESCSRSKKGNNNKKKTARVQSAIVEKVEPKSQQQVDNEKPSLPSKHLVGGVDSELRGEGKRAQVMVVAKKAPALNYAAALSMKLAKETNSGRDDNSKQQVEKTEQKVTMQASGAIKRNRSVSSSSWSSNNDLEAIESIWNDMSTSGLKVEDVVLVEFGQEVVANDNESIISSGFSDCDYGYNCINDYVMRPKKSQQNKRRRKSSTSSSLVSSMSRQGAEREKVVSRGSSSSQQEQQSSAKSSGSKFSNGRSPSSLAAATTSKNVRAKRSKKVVLSASSTANCVEFLKRRSSLINTSAEPVASGSGELLQEPSSESVCSSQEAEFDECLLPPAQLENNGASLMPSPMAMTASSTFACNNDPMYMDESWFVTPPPCFTGSDKLDKSKSKGAARENALIEHPSFYIASTSKQHQQQEEQKKKKNDSTGNSSPASTGTVLHKTTSASANSKQLEPTEGADKLQVKATTKVAEKKRDETTKKAKQRKQVQQVASAKSKKEAWDNKFIVTNWLYDDEQDEVDDDFDNLFPAQIPPKREKRQAKGQASKKQQAKEQEQQQRMMMAVEEDLSLLENSASFESDSSTSIPCLVSMGSSSVSSDDQLSVNKEQQQLVEESPVSVDSENTKVAGSGRRTSEKKAPTQVRPIEAERSPGWQLRKKRSKRHPLSSLTINSSAGARGKQQHVATNVMTKSVTLASIQQQQQLTSSNGGRASPSLSARSSPSSLIDRIGNSIVANLTNLASGFPSAAGTMNQLQGRNEALGGVEQLNQTLARKSSSELNQTNRRRLSKAYLNRQNDCARLANSNRRAGRRLKMHSVPNGSSVNRKVHATIH